MTDGAPRNAAHLLVMSTQTDPSAGQPRGENGRPPGAYSERVRLAQEFADLEFSESEISVHGNELQPGDIIVQRAADGTFGDRGRVFSTQIPVNDRLKMLVILQDRRGVMTVRTTDVLNIRRSEEAPEFDATAPNSEVMAAVVHPAASAETLTAAVNLVLDGPSDDDERFHPQILEAVARNRETPEAALIRITQMPRGMWNTGPILEELVRNPASRTRILRPLRDSLVGEVAAGVRVSAAQRGFWGETQARSVLDAVNSVLQERSNVSMPSVHCCAACHPSNYWPRPLGRREMCGKCSQLIFTPYSEDDQKQACTRCLGQCGKE